MSHQNKNLIISRWLIHLDEMFDDYINQSLWYSEFEIVEIFFLIWKVKKRFSISILMKRIYQTLAICINNLIWILMISRQSTFIVEFYVLSLFAKAITDVVGDENNRPYLRIFTETFPLILL